MKLHGGGEGKRGRVRIREASLPYNAVQFVSFRFSA
jgi:hypothetical protein